MNTHNLYSWIRHGMLMFGSVMLLACGGGGSGDAGTGGVGGSGGPATLSFNHAGYNPLMQTYQYGYNSISNITVTGQPEDTDWSRYAMLHDGEVHRLYLFKAGSNDTLYQFGYNPNTANFEYGYRSIPTLRITGIPADADPTSFAMLHDGADYRLYMRSTANPARIYQSAFNRTTNRYEYGYHSIAVIDVTGAPADVDWDRWAMLYDGQDYRHYAMRENTATELYQFGFNPSAGDYQYGYRSIPTLRVENMPADSDTTNFAMSHDGADYHFYALVL